MTQNSTSIFNQSGRTNNDLKPQIFNYKKYHIREKKIC